MNIPRLDRLPRLLLAALATAAATLCPAAGTPEATRSPTNQVFQYSHTATCKEWSNGTEVTAVTYLWIPEQCRRLRGLLVLCANVPEHMLVGHTAVRQLCAEQDLGIVWAARTFYNFKAKGDDRTVVSFLQKLLDGLAEESGYDEVATVPWLPIGESGHLLMVDALVEVAPQRCIAGVWLKNSHLPPRNRETPALVVFGSGQEWGQEKADFLNLWRDVGDEYEKVVRERAAHPRWPLSYVVDGSSGHFDCSERVTQYLVQYIRAAVSARLPMDRSATLRAVDLETGFFADLPVPGRSGSVSAAKATHENARAVPWYFDRSLAEDARGFAAINWNAETQLPAFADDEGNVFPFTFNGISSLPLNKAPQASPGTAPSPVVRTEADGVTFMLKPVLLESLPGNFRDAGRRLARAPGEPVIEWLCGCVEPVGDGRFRLALDRTWPSPIYIAVRHAGTDRIRAVVQPGQISRERNTEGTAQKITFARIPDVPAGTRSVPLQASTNAGMPVRFFVVSGPATVRDATLVFTDIPPRSRLPLTVTVGAWQWGRSTEPKVQTADIVRQSFQIVPPQ